MRGNFPVTHKPSYEELERKVQELEKEMRIRTRAEEALRESGKRYRSLVETSSDLLWEIDANGRYAYVNSRVREIFGYAPEEVVGRTPFDLMPEEEARRLGPIFAEIAAERRPFSLLENVNLHRDGRRVVLETSGVPVFGPDGEFAGYRGMDRDITERKLAEEALRESETRYRLLAENATDVIWTVGMDMRLTYVSPSVTRLLGFTAEEAMARTMQQAYTAAAHEKAMQILAEEIALESAGRHDPNRTRMLELELVHKDGKIIPVEGNYCFLRDPTGKAIGLLAIVRDITERKRAGEERRRLEELLQRAEKMEALGTLAGGVAHDLNNVLGVVVGYSDLLLLKVTDESVPIKSHVMEILKAGERATAIVEDLLTLTRRGVSSRKVLNLNDIVRECRNSPEFVKIFSYHPNILVKTDLEAGLLNISGSAVHLGKSLLNLVSNAAEAMSTGGAMIIKTSNQYLDKPILGYDEVSEGDYVILSVSDTGEGVAVADLKRIFEPFYTKKVMGRSGTGLGLSVVWGTVKDHYGYINVESEQGKGSTFTLYFPVTREEMSPEQVSVSVSEYTGRGEAILVVDDVREQRDLSTAMLTKLNYSVMSVSSGEEALEYLKQHQVDLVVLDMIMDPGMDGLDTYSGILEIHPQQKAIIVSGFSETKRVAKAQALGAGTYVKKPYSLEKLGLAVRKELDKPARPALSKA
jgi:PAS domain S-box-containing protein